MKDIAEELGGDIANFVSGADQGVVQSQKEVKRHYPTSLAYNIKQREFFDLVKNKISAKTGKLSIPKFLLFLWNYHLQKSKCNPKEYLDYYIFLSMSGTKGDLKNVTLNWDLSLNPLKQFAIASEMTLGRISVKGVVLLLALHYVIKNKLDIDLTPYKN